MRDSTVITVSAITAITVLEAIALTQLHIDGALLSSVVAVLAGLAGYRLRDREAQRDVQSDTA